MRPPRLEDYEAWTNLRNDEEVGRYVGGSQSKFQEWRDFMSVVGSWTMQGFGFFSVIERSSGSWIGRIGPWQPADWPGPEVGWGLVRHAWGNGYATEGARAVLDWVFGDLGWSEVIHSIHPNNVASQSVARRVGSSHQRAGRLPVPIDAVPVEIWGQSRAQWNDHRCGRTHNPAADRALISMS